MESNRFGLRRLLICLPAAALIGLGVVMLILAPSAWGKGDQVNLPAWMPTASTVFFGLPAVLIGLIFLRQLLRLTRGDFGVSALQLAGSMLAVVVGIALEIGLLSRVTSGSTYDSLRDSSGNVTTTPTAFMVYTIIGVLLMSLLVGGAAYIYCQAVTAISHRFDRTPDERDAIGEMLHHQPGSHA